MKIGNISINWFYNLYYQFIPKFRYRNGKFRFMWSLSLFFLKYCLRIDYNKKKNNGKYI